jgi:hypothetical protein
MRRAFRKYKRSERAESAQGEAIKSSKGAGFFYFKTVYVVFVPAQQ